MRIVLFTLTALTASIALGNLCMMNMTHAQDMAHDMHGGSSAMEETHMADCENCVQHDERTTDDIPAPTMDCSSGQCFMHAAPTGSADVHAPNPPPTVAHTHTHRVWFSVPADLFRAHRSTAPPGFIAHTKTIVLRC